MNRHARATTTNISEQAKEDFFRYVYAFYGKFNHKTDKTLFGFDEDLSWINNDALYHITMFYLHTVREESFCLPHGDSVDRERIRSLIDTIYRYYQEGEGCLKPQGYYTENKPWQWENDNVPTNK